jgi:hypothetical protein
MVANTEKALSHAGFNPIMGAESQMFDVAKHATLKSFSSSQRFYLQQFSKLFIAGIYSLCWKSGSYMLAQGIGSQTEYLDPYKLLHQVST